MERKRQPRHRINAFGEKLTFVKGRFDTTEDDIILKSLAIGLKKRGMLPSDIGTKKNYDGLFREIAEQLPDRSIERVYDRTKILINPHKLGPWTFEETLELKKLVEHGESWKSIEEKLNRSANNCRHQVRRLNEIDWDNYKLTEQFSEDELERLRQELISVLGMQNKNATFLQIDNATQEQKKHDGMRAIPWSKIALNFPGRSNCVLKTKYHELIEIAKADRRAKEEEMKHGLTKATHTPEHATSDNQEQEQLFKDIQKKHCLDVMIIAVETWKQGKSKVSDESSKLKRVNAQWPLTLKTLQMDSVVETITSSQNIMDAAERLNTTNTNTNVAKPVTSESNSNINNHNSLAETSVENVDETIISTNATNIIQVTKTLVHSENQPSTKKRKGERKHKKKKKKKKSSNHLSTCH